MGGCCSRAMRRTRSHLSARAAATRASRMPMRSPGGWSAWFAAKPMNRFSTPGHKNDRRPPTRTSSTPPAVPTSSRPSPRLRCRFATPPSSWPRRCRLRGAWSTAADCRRPPLPMTVRRILPMPMPPIPVALPPRRCAPARLRSTRPCCRSTASRSGGSTVSAASSTC